MLGFGTGRDVPPEVRKAGLAEWYGSLSEADRVKAKRYTGSADASSPAAFLISLARAASADENHGFVAAVAQGCGHVEMSDLGRYEMNEVAIPSLFRLGRYDACERLCDAGLDMLCKGEVRESVLARGNGAYPEDVNCRNYKINVVVGVRFEYGDGDAILDRYVEGGLITAEEAELRKESIKAFRMQRTLDGIFSVKEKG